MLNKFLKTSRLTVIAASLATLGACNKLYEPVPYTAYSEGDVANTVYKKLAANTNYSVFVAALVRTGISAELDVANAKFTVFAPDNTAMATAGITSTTVAAIPLADLTAAINYHIIPAENILFAQIPEAFPNVEKKSKLNITTTAFIASIPTTAIPIKMSIFPSKRGTTAWANNIPVVSADIMTGSNGVVHRVAAVVAPPTRVLLDTLSRDTDFSYFMAAVVRADSGLVTTASPSLQYALGQPFANLTVFAPTNAAFQAVLYAKAYPIVWGQMYKAVYDAQIAGGADAATADAAAKAYADANAPAATTALVGSPTVFSNAALYGVLTAQVVRGIVVYHFMGQRAYSVNFGSTAANYPTLLNSAIPSHPGLAISSTLSSGLGVGLSVKGAANATAATAAPASASIPLVDRNAVNGNFFKINQVLLPQ
ncbi:hypothetical protein ESA94_02140 [Lacibacter luteus]|uniref:FAS1 domain-containing protein n=1 Tax=Lacibacter luteus TaxID=2508719 RepID=A0A4Q1CLF0_9BACT|nr:fasciclin domain-containing protein [Lacibacter luteus]RXK61837.1 hypothetical protein ESA94_02140 [Lacibacter luteus]